MPEPIQNPHVALNNTGEDALPEVLFEGWRVYCALSEEAIRRTSHENVSDVLDAVVRLMCKEMRKQ